jgi:hypothetical protein
MPKMPPFFPIERSLSDADVERIARRVAELLNETARVVPSIGDDIGPQYIGDER